MPFPPVKPAALALAAALSFGAAAQKAYDPGADDKEIRVGNVMPYSGPASAFGTIGKAIGAYFDKVNADGGVNGRRLKLLSRDDGYNPARTLEQVRRLVEDDEVLLIFQPLGTAPNTAIQRYLNDKKVPQLFVSAGATKFADPKNFPWTMGWHPNYQTEARIYATHILEHNPNAKIAVLYQNDDYGKDYLKGLEDGLGARAAKMIVAKASYEATDPTIDSQMLTLKASGADTFVNITASKFSAQAIRKAAELGWRPTQYLNCVSNAVGSVLTPAGLDNATGIFSVAYLRDPTDPQFQSGPAYDDWLAWMKKYHTSGDVRDNFSVYGYTVAQTLVQVLRQSGDNLTRANVMKQATNLDLTLPMLLPGISIKTGADDYMPIKRAQLVRFDGKSWKVFGKVYGR